MAADGDILVVDFPCVGSILRHELQVLNPDCLVLKLGHRVVHALLPRCDVILLTRWGRWQLISPQEKKVKMIGSIFWTTNQQSKIFVKKSEIDPANYFTRETESNFVFIINSVLSVFQFYEQYIDICAKCNKISSQHSSRSQDVRFQWSEKSNKFILVC